jgi:GTP pyrophosphokinase
VALSKSQIDRLGERLRDQEATELDLIELDAYRRSFGQAYEKALSTAAGFAAHSLTGRIKSNASIIAKLRRESIRLTQIQDIAGCRVVVDGTSAQMLVVLGLKDVNPDALIADRRWNSSHGYRAVHVITRFDDRLIEVQVRTNLQHRWAEVSEKYSDVIDPLIKYGDGDPEIQGRLMQASADIAEVEKLELEYDGSIDMLLDYQIIEGLERHKQRAHVELDALVQQLDDLERYRENR